MRLKPAFVENGFMIGEFYPGNTTGGLHNTAFKPLDVPVPCLAVRHMHIADAPFMLSDSRYEAAFVRRFGKEGEQALIIAQQLTRLPIGQVVAEQYANGESRQAQRPL